MKHLLIIALLVIAGFGIFYHKPGISLLALAYGIFVFRAEKVFAKKEKEFLKSPLRAKTVSCIIKALEDKEVEASGSFI